MGCYRASINIYAKATKVLNPMALMAFSSANAQFFLPPLANVSYPYDMQKEIKMLSVHRLDTNTPHIPPRLVRRAKFGLKCGKNFIAMIDKLGEVISNCFSRRYTPIKQVYANAMMRDPHIRFLKETKNCLDAKDTSLADDLEDGLLLSSQFLKKSLAKSLKDCFPMDYFEQGEKIFFAAIPRSGLPAAPRNYRLEFNIRKIQRKLNNALYFANEQQNLLEIESNEMLSFYAFEKSEIFKETIDALIEKPFESTRICRDKNLASYAIKGPKAMMQDRILLQSFRCMGQNVFVSAVFDGHGELGEEVAAFARKNFVSFFARRIKVWKELSLRSIWNALKITCADLSHQYFRTGGSTANIALFVNEQLWIANVGDSRSILIDPYGNVQQLSEDATCNARYKNSIEKRGGFIVDQRVCGILQPARSLADHEIPGVNPRPKITLTHMPAKDWSGHLLLQCSDGISDLASSDCIGKKVHAFLRKRESHSLQDAVQLLSLAADQTRIQMADKIEKDLGHKVEARDDISVILRRF